MVPGPMVAAGGDPSRDLPGVTSVPPRVLGRYLVVNDQVRVNDVHLAPVVAWSWPLMVTV